MKVKNNLVVQTIEIREKAKNGMFWLKRRHMKGEKKHYFKGFCRILRKLDVSENFKFVMAHFWTSWKVLLF